MLCLILLYIMNIFIDDFYKKINASHFRKEEVEYEFERK